MTNMQVQKRKFLGDALKDIQAFAHLTGNNEAVVAVKAQLEGLKVLI